MRGAVAIALCTMLAGATSVDAQPTDRKRVAILTKRVGDTSGDAQLSAVSLLEQAQKVIDYCPALESLSRADLFGPATADVGNALLACGTDYGCMAARLSRAAVEVGLEVMVNTRLKPPIVTSTLIFGPSDVVTSVAELEGDPRGTAARLEAHLFEILERSGYEIGGRLSVDVTPGDATVELDPRGEPDPRAPNVFTLPPGEYAVTAHRDGYEPLTARVEIHAKRPQRVSLELVEAASWLDSPWLWIALGAAAAGATFGAIAIASGGDDARGTLCLANAPTDCGSH